MARLRVGRSPRLVSSCRATLPPAPSPVVAWRLAAVRSSPRPRSAPLTAPLVRPVSRLRRCATPWCYVDPNHCDLPSFESSVAKVKAAGLHFSYKKCNASFTGNAYVGHCQCVGHTGAFDGTMRPVNWGGVCEAWNVQDSKWPACVSANPPDW